MYGRIKEKVRKIVKYGHMLIGYLAFASALISIQSGYSLFGKVNWKIAFISYPLYAAGLFVVFLIIKSVVKHKRNLKF